MKVTPEIINGEFIGTRCKITGSRHSGYVGIKGEVIDESRNTFTILQSGEPKSVVKEGAIFQFGYSDGTIVEIAGKLLVGRPEDRLKKSVKRLW
jgi:ribonuclease P protein subunit POP4